MGTLDLGMDAEADAELERAERERLARRAAAQAEAASARDSAGYGDAALSRALSGLQAAPEAPAAPPPAALPFQRNAAPFTPAEQARIGQVEQRLQSGDRAGVEADTRALQGGPEGMARPAVPVAPSAPMATPAVAAGRDPGMRAPAASLGAPASTAPRPAATRARGPEFIDPEAEDDGPRGSSASSLSSPIEAEKTQRRNAESSQADAEIARWDARIQEVQREMSQARDQRTRAVLGNLLANLVLTASRVLTGTRGSSTIPMRQDAFDERARERLSDRSREWSATDDMILRAQELREGQRTRATEADLRSQREQRESQTLDLQRTREERTARIAEARLRLQEASSETERREAMLELQRNDPESAESERARRRYVASAMARERALGSAGRSAIDLETEVRGLAATDIEAMEGELASMTVGTRTSRAGSGGGGTRDRSALLAEATAAGIPSATAGTMTDRELARSIEMRGRRSGDGEQGEMILPGIQAGPGLTSPGEARAMRHGFSQARAQMGALGEIERVAGQYGPTAAIDRRAAGELAAPVASLRAMVAQLQNTGVINPSEAPAIEAMLPNPQSLAQMTFGDLQNRLRSFRGALERGIDSELLARGVTEDGRRSAIAMLRGGGEQRAAQEAPAEEAPAASGAQYRVTSPDGRTITRTLSPEQLRTFRASRGFTVEEVR